MAPQRAVYFFGDQNADLNASIKAISQEARRSNSLNNFLTQCADVLMALLSKLSPQESPNVSAFQSPLELVDNISGDHRGHPAISSALSCIAQFGDLIIRSERDPKILKSADEIIIVGLCTGSLPAAAVSCCDDLQDLVRLGPWIVRVAFQLGLEIDRRSRHLDSSGKSWAVAVSNVTYHVARNIIDNFYADKTDQPTLNRAYLSANGNSFVTISGTQSALTKILALPEFRECRTTNLPVHAAYHASHLYPVQGQDIIDQLGLSKNWSLLPTRHVVSAGTGEIHTADNLQALLVDLIEEISQVPISWTNFASTVSNMIDQEDGGDISVPLFIFGPTNAQSTIKQHLPNLKLQNTLTAQDRLIPDIPTRNGTRLVAIVGAAVRLPGSETIEEFWETLQKRHALHEKVRKSRFDLETHHDASGKKKNSTLVPFGCFLDRPGYFDPRFFNMSPREATQTDPQQRLILLATYEALENAGYQPNRTPSSDTKRVGTFIGVTSDDWRETNASQEIDIYYITGNNRAFGPGRLNYFFGWEGPSFCLDTACSSSFGCIQLAYSSLLARECDTAIAGGANVLTNSDLFAGLSRASFLSHSGGCKTLDDDADGYCRADGVGVVVLKRLEDALADRDNIRGVIRSVVTNHSAEAVSITHPHAGTQARLFADALREGGITADDVNYVELHGTGTQAGDAAEMESVTKVFAQQRTSSNPLYVGSVKPNVGHSESASGVTSLIKALLILQKNTIPPHVGIKNTINRKFPTLDQLNVQIPLVDTPFVASFEGRGKRRVLINNFDAAGGNTCVLLEDGPNYQIRDLDPRMYHVVTLSGKTVSAVTHNRDKLLKYLRENSELPLRDIAYTLTARRMHHSCRIAYSARDTEELIALMTIDFEKKADSFHSQRQPHIVFIFTGQGSQYANMALELMKTNHGFRRDILEYVKICLGHGFPSFEWLISNDNVDVATASPVEVQLAIVSLELALSKWWHGLGVKPTFVVGHSLGEYTALCAASILTESDCLYLVGTRAKLMQEKCTPGSHCMLVIARPAEDARYYLARHALNSCEVVCINSPDSTVIGGSMNDINRLEGILKSHKVRVVRLDLPYAFHSSQVDPILDEFAMSASAINFSKPEIPFTSTLLRKLVTKGEVINAEYLREQTRQSADFLGALKALKAAIPSEQDVLWIEVGPQALCLGMIRTTLGVPDFRLIASMDKKENNWQTLSKSLSKVYKGGIDIDWSQYQRQYEPALRLLDLPAYVFDLEDYWIQYEGDWKLSKGKTTNKVGENSTSWSSGTLHRIETETVDDVSLLVIFISDVSAPILNSILSGHAVLGFELCAVSTYMEMALAASSYMYRITDTGCPSLRVRDITVLKPLIISSDRSTQQIVVKGFRDRKLPVVNVSFHARLEGHETEYARCFVQFEDSNVWQSEWARLAHLIDSRICELVKSSERSTVHRIQKPMVYKLFSSLMKYGDRFKTLQEVHMDSENLEAAAEVRLGKSQSGEYFCCSPYWIEGVLHLAGFILNGNENVEDDVVYLVDGLGSHRALSTLSAEKKYHSYVRMHNTGIDNLVTGNVYLLEADKVVVMVEDLRFKRFRRSSMQRFLSTCMSEGSTLETPLDAKPKPGISISRDEKLSDENADDLFRELLELVARESGTQVLSFGKDTQFADEGVDSLLSITIVSKLNQTFRLELPATLFVEYPSVGELQAFFEQNFNNKVGTGKPHKYDCKPATDFKHELSTVSLPTISEFSTQISRTSSLDSGVGLKLVDETYPRQATNKEFKAATSVCLRVGQSSHNESTLFLLPDGSGSASSYIRLSSSGIPGSVYGLNSPFVDCPWPPNVPLESVAAAYTDEIRRIQPHGPYVLGGWSIGGAYAFEVAKQMIEKFDEEVQRLLLIDAPCPNNSLIPLSEGTLSILEEIGIFKSTTDQKRKTIQHFRGSIEALGNYRPAAIRSHKGPERVTIIWARNGVLENRKIERSHEPEWVLDPRTEYGTCGWGELLPQASSHAHQIDGDHWSIMELPTVSKLSSLVGRAVAPSVD